MVTKSERNDWHTYGRLTSYVRSRAWYFVIALLAFFLAAIAEVFFAQILGSVVSSFEANSDTSAGNDLATNTVSTNVLVLDTELLSGLCSLADTNIVRVYDW